MEQHYKESCGASHLPATAVYRDGGMPEDESDGATGEGTGTRGT